MIPAHPGCQHRQWPPDSCPGHADWLDWLPLLEQSSHLQCRPPTSMLSPVACYASSISSSLTFQDCDQMRFRPHPASYRPIKLDMKTPNHRTGRIQVHNKQQIIQSIVCMQWSSSFRVWSLNPSMHMCWPWWWDSRITETSTYSPASYLQLSLCARAWTLINFTSLLPIEVYSRSLHLTQNSLTNFSPATVLIIPIVAVWKHCA